MTGWLEFALFFALTCAAFILIYFWDCFRWGFIGRVGAGIGLIALMGARLRGVPPRILVEGLLLAREANVPVSPDDLEMLHLSGGNVRQAMAAVVAARKADVNFSWRMASYVTLSGGEPLSAVSELVAARREQLHAELQQLPEERVAALRGARATVEYAVPLPGVVSANGQKLVAVSQTGPIDKGSAVDIVDVYGYIAVVRQADINEEGETHAGAR